MWIILSPKDCWLVQHLVWFGSAALLSLLLNIWNRTPSPWEHPVSSLAHPLNKCCLPPWWVRHPQQLSMLATCKHRCFPVNKMLRPIWLPPYSELSKTTGLRDLGVSSRGWPCHLCVLCLHFFQLYLQSCKKSPEGTVGHCSFHCRQDTWICGDQVLLRFG